MGKRRKTPSSGTRRVAKRVPDASRKSACLCTTCQRPIVNDVKHCVLGDDALPFVLCDTCYLRDERRYGWEHRANPFPATWGKVVSR